MSGVHAIDQRPSYYGFVAQPQSGIVIILASLVFAAGAATMGVALAGYIPYEYFYAGLGTMALDLVIASTLLAINYLRQKEPKIKITEPPPVPEPQIVFEKEFPNEMVSELFTYLDCKTLGRARLVCRAWNELGKQPSLFKEFVDGSDWQEENPDYYTAYRMLNRLGTVKKQNHKLELTLSISDPWLPGSSIYHENESIRINKIHELCTSGNHGVLFKNDELSKGTLFRIESKKGDKLIFYGEFELKLNGLAVKSKAFYGNILYLGMNDKNILVYDCNSGRQSWLDFRDKLGRPIPVDSIEVTQDGLFIFHTFDKIIQARMNNHKLQYIPFYTGAFFIKDITKDMFSGFGELFEKSLSRKIITLNARCFYKDRVVTFFRYGDFFSSAKEGLAVWYPEGDKIELLLEDIGLNLIKKTLISGPILIVGIDIKKSSDSKVRFYDLEQKKWLNDIRMFGNLMGVCSGFILSCYLWHLDFRRYGRRIEGSVT